MPTIIGITVASMFHCLFFPIPLSFFPHSLEKSNSSCSIVFFFHFIVFFSHSLEKSNNSFIFLLSFIFKLRSAGRQNPLDDKFFFLLLINTRLVFWPGLCDPFLSQNSREFNKSFFLEQILISALPFGKYVGGRSRG